jgi:hypothetical protein
MLHNIKLLSPICSPVCFCVTVTTERVRLQVILKFSIKLIASLDIMSYIRVDKYQSFGGNPGAFLFNVEDLFTASQFLLILLIFN